jgi:dihydroorotase-like cyclic amidohydrolase
LDYSEYFIGPGLIDMNVKVNGSWEGRSIASQQAISGGVTFFLENPNLHGMNEEVNTPVYCDYARLELLDDD